MFSRNQANLRDLLVCKASELIASKMGAGVLRVPVEPPGERRVRHSHVFGGLLRCEAKCEASNKVHEWDEEGRHGSTGHKDVDDSDECHEHLNERQTLSSPTELISHPYQPFNKCFASSRVLIAHDADRTLVNRSGKLVAHCILDYCLPRHTYSSALSVRSPNDLPIEPLYGSPEKDLLETPRPIPEEIRVPYSPALDIRPGVFLSILNSMLHGKCQATSSVFPGSPLQQQPFKVLCDLRDSPVSDSAAKRPGLTVSHGDGCTSLGSSLASPKSHVKTVHSIAWMSPLWLDHTTACSPRTLGMALMQAVLVSNPRHRRSMTHACSVRMATSWCTHAIAFIVEQGSMSPKALASPKSLFPYSGTGMASLLLITYKALKFSRPGYMAIVIELGTPSKLPRWSRLQKLN
ncbi:hypothetical protein EYF80_043545 [Liparis tanakae]|uniref:Uncharacterized protein n=1 Tax=Liparis tanakae TaxID=230148 RepID=A0A4Z2FZK3_9TELE|nr:hypothetical protein EYF80_043545 [Liparis tanakae]